VPLNVRFLQRQRRDLIPAWANGPENAPQIHQGLKARLIITLPLIIPVPEPSTMALIGLR